MILEATVFDAGALEEKLELELILLAGVSRFQDICKDHVHAYCQ